MLTVLPRKEANYWRMDQLNISMEELPEAIKIFIIPMLEAIWIAITTDPLKLRDSQIFHSYLYTEL